MTDEQMREIAARMREAATKVGTTSALWDVVFDAEAILTGEVSWADRKTVERRAKQKFFHGSRIQIARSSFS